MKHKFLYYIYPFIVFIFCTLILLGAATNFDRLILREVPEIIFSKGDSVYNDITGIIRVGGRLYVTGGIGLDSAITLSVGDTVMSETAIKFAISDSCDTVRTGREFDDAYGYIPDTLTTLLPVANQFYPLLGNQVLTDSNNFHIRKGAGNTLVYDGLGVKGRFLITSSVGVDKSGEYTFVIVHNTDTIWTSELPVYVTKQQPEVMTTYSHVNLNTNDSLLIFGRSIDQTDTELTLRKYKFSFRQ